MAAEPTAAEVCELCGEELPELATLSFRRGKQRRVCVLCLALAIQSATGFKVVNVVRRMLEARIEAPAMREAALRARLEMAEAARLANG